MSDPKRLLDETGDGELARLLRAGKSEMPDAAQLGALAAKVGVVAGAGVAGASAGGGGAGAAAGATAKAGLAMKIGGVLVVASAVGATAVVATAPREEKRSPVGLVASAPTVVAPSASHVVLLPTATSEPVPTPSTAPPPSARPSAPQPTSSADVSPEAEVRLLERAQDALRANPAQALSLADEHARRFPRGMLAQEREVIAVEALAKLGRTDEARARAARFKARFPGSSHTRRLDALLGE